MSWNDDDIYDDDVLNGYDRYEMNMIVISRITFAPYGDHNCNKKVFINFIHFNSTYILLNLVVIVVMIDMLPFPDHGTIIWV